MFYQYRFILVIAILCIAAYLVTEKGKLPLALRGLKRTLQRDRGEQPLPVQTEKVPMWKRLLAFVLVIVAFILSVLPNPS